MSREDEVRGVLTRASVVLLVGVAALVAVVWTAATPRPPLVISRPTASVTVTQHAFDDVDLRPTSEFNRPPWMGPNRTGSAFDVVLGWGAVALVAGAGLLLLLVIVRALWRAWLERRRTDPDDASVDDLERVASAVATDREGRLVALAAGTPAEGIVAAWTRLERSLVDAGVALPASRTSTETSLDVLRRFRVDEDALRELGALYREASWSSHPMSEDARERAEAALRSLDADLARAAGRRVRA
jgi:hypothetical protein